MDEDHHNLSLAGTLYASIREVDTHYKDERMRDWEHSVSALSDMGLEVKTTHHHAHQAKDVLETLKHLKTGSYEMSLPIYSLTGKLKGFHSLGLIITESGTCYLLESNLAIGVIKRTELVQTVGRLFTEYTGLDYTNTLEGERPPSWKRIANIIQERANPPKDLSMPYFGLLEVELSSTLKDSPSAA